MKEFVNRIFGRKYSIVFLIAVLLFSCKTNDKFAIHKRRYNPGIYIEKNHAPENFPVVGKAKKNTPKFGPTAEIQVANTGELTSSVNFTKEPEAPLKTISEKRKITFLQSNFPTIINKKTKGEHKTTRQKNKKDVNPSGFSSVVTILAFSLIISGIIAGIGGLYLMFIVGGFGFPFGLVLFGYALLAIIIGLILMALSK